MKLKHTTIALFLLVGIQQISLGQHALVEGKHGKALDLRQAAAGVIESEDFSQFPLTVECWAKLDSKQGFNILLASEPKASASHWELYTYAGSGQLSLYLPGIATSDIRAPQDICDGEWHHLGLELTSRQVRMFVDGEQVVRREIDEPHVASEPTPLAVGRLVEGGLGCDGLIDSLHIRRGAGALPPTLDRPPVADETTLGLWTFDSISEADSFLDESERAQALDRIPAVAARGAAKEMAAQTASLPEQDEKITGHWGEDAIGFRWTEEDSVDGRWQAMDKGPFLATSVQVNDQIVLKGLVIQLGESDQGAILYDTASMSVAASWLDEFLTTHPARYGLIRHPTPGGELSWAQPTVRAWMDSQVRYRGLSLNGSRCLLHYEVDDAKIAESPRVLSEAGHGAYLRSLQIGPHAQELTLNLGFKNDASFQQVQREGWQVLSSDQLPPGRSLALRWSDNSLPAPQGLPITVPQSDGEFVGLKLPAARESRQLQIVFASREQLESDAVLPAIEPMDVRRFEEPGPRLWNAQLVTTGARGEPNRGLRMDTIEVPFDNPYQALMFLSGIDFFRNGDAAVSTVHGDVWVVSGLNDSLDEVRWRRFATGLFQPLGLKVIDDQVYVLGKDQITHLQDRDGNGEADLYLNFNNAGDTSPGNHDYAACLETDSAGNFYYVRGNTGVERVSRDGRSHEVIATGLRNPNGMGIGPEDLITVAPQEGEWTPASNIAVIQRGGHYGYRGPQVTEARPLGYDPPMIWLPRLLDNSSGGQVWLPDQGWGELNGGMIHLSFGRCWPLLVLPENVAGMWQAAAVKLPFECRSGLCRGSIQPATRHLFLAGLKGWASASVDDGCLVRLVPVSDRYPLPIEQRVVQNGMVLKFGTELNRTAVQDPSNWSAQQWNYRYASDYGSADYKVSSPGQQGHDEVEIVSATLQSDGQSVFLEIPAIQPVMQMAITYRLEDAQASAIDDTLFLTIHKLGSERIQPGPHAALAAAKRAERPTRDSLAPGVLLRLNQQSISGTIEQDTRVNRWVALEMDGDPISSVVESRALTAVFEGWLYLEQKESIEFLAMASGALALEIDGQMIVPVDDSPTQTRWPPAVLDKGLNRIRVTWNTVEEPRSGLRLMWSGQGFAWEPVPPDRWFHDPVDARLVRATEYRLAREEFANFQCHRCHALPESTLRSVTRMPELDFTAPSLERLGARRQNQWLFDWIMAPRHLDSQSEMPHLFDSSSESDRQTVADIVAYLVQTASGEATTSEDRGEREQEWQERSERGLFQFEELGCVACHRVGVEDAGRDRISLDHVAKKFKPAALERFLQDPTRFHPSHRMPVFRLKDSERQDLAAFLLTESDTRSPEATPSGDPLRGAQAFVDRSCAQCHQVAPETSLRKPTQAIVDARSQSGCLGDSLDTNSPHVVPDYGLDSRQRERLRDLVETQLESLALDGPDEIASRWMTRLRCNACHQLDGGGGSLAEVLFDESVQGLSPERLPDLTWTGEKFREPWLAEFIKDASRPPLRPWLLARMPAFPAYAERLAEGLASQHALSATDLEFERGPTVNDAAMLPMGAQFLGQAKGFDCRQCHALGELPATGDQQTQVALGVNLADSAQRLNYGYYRRWMIDPLRIDPLTKMPKYSEDGRTTKLSDVLDGDALGQFDAIWAYLQQLDAGAGKQP